MLIYAPWTKFCLKGQDANAKQVCFTGKDGRIESGQPVIAAVVIEPEGETKKVLRVTLPLGMGLANGTRITVDDNSPATSSYVICFANGCMSDYELTPALLASLRNGGSLTVQAIQDTGRVLTLALPLAEFNAAYSGPPTDPKVFEAAQKKLQEELAQRAAAARERAQNNPSGNVVAVARPADPVTLPAASRPAAVPFGRRVALVIGNSAYQHAPTLPNPRRDAVMVADALRQANFQSVTLQNDLGREQLVNALRDFARQAEGADWAVVYYAGHGMEVAGVNYLIPVDARIATDRDINLEAVSMDQVLNSAERAKKLRLVLLDACRDNPFADQMRRTMTTASRSVSRGLAQMEPDPGTLVVFAAKHGETAMDGDGNSPFALAFVRDIKTPGVEVRRLFDNVRDDVMDMTGRQQQPYSYGSVSGRQDFYFTAAN
jgi:invasion protein IalB